MRAILIDPTTKTIKEIEHSGDYKQIYDLIGNGCQSFTSPLVTDGGDAFYCDDEGLYNPNIGGVISKNWAYPLVGRVLIIGTDINGDSTDAISTIEELENYLTFVDKNDPKLENWFAQFN